MGRRSRSTPAETVDGWPDTPSTDPAVETVRLLVINLRAATHGRTLRAVEADTGVTYTTIHAILAGKAWPDGLTVARLEAGLGQPLWPGPLGGRTR